MPQVPIPQGGSTIRRKSDQATFFLGEGSKYDPSVYDLVSSPTAQPVAQPVVSQPTVQPSPVALTKEQELKAIQEKLSQARAQAEQVSSSVRYLVEAEKKGLPITSQTSVQDAKRFLSQELDQTPPVLDFTKDQAYVSSLLPRLNVPSSEALRQEMGRLREQKKFVGGELSELLAEKPEPLDFQKTETQALRNLGFGEDFTRQQFDKISGARAEAAALQTQLTNLTAQEQQSLARIGDQPIPLENISTQQQKVLRDNAIRKWSLSAEITSKFAYVENLRGDFEMVSRLVDKTVQYAMYEKQQEVSDWKWMFDTYKDQYDELTDLERKIWWENYNQVVREEELERDTLKEKLNMYLTNGVEILDVEQLKGMSLSEVAKDVLKRTPPKPVKVEGAKIGISDVRGLGLPSTAIGFTEEQIGKDLNSATPPQWFLDWIQGMESRTVSPQEAQSRWVEWRNEKQEQLTSGGGLNFGAFGLPVPVQ